MKKRHIKQIYAKKFLACLLSAAIVFAQPVFVQATAESTEMEETETETAETQSDETEFAEMEETETEIVEVQSDGSESIESAVPPETEETKTDEEVSETESESSEMHTETVQETDSPLPSEMESEIKTENGMESETETEAEQEIETKTETISETEVQETETESEQKFENELETADSISVYGFSEDALSFVLSSDQIEEKSQLGEVVSSLDALTAGEDYIENEIVFCAQNEQEAQEIAESYGGELVSYAYGIAVVRIQAQVIDAVRAAADIKTALPPVYPNLIYEICEDFEKDVYEVPDDPHYDRQWYLDSMRVPAAWEGTKGEGIRIAVIDTGISYEHEDLAQNVIGHESVLDYSEDAANGRDDHSHGTHCAGIIAAVADNGKGIAGIAPAAQIYSVKVMNNKGRGDTAGIARGINLSVRADVDIISMSLSQVTYDHVLGQAISMAVDKGIVAVAAAGNYGTKQKYYPAAYEDVIAVAATANTKGGNGRYQLADFSNYGGWIDIAAPGAAIYSTIPSGYGYKNGTSMACPAVVGVLALILSYSPSLRNNNTRAGVAAIKDALMKSALAGGAEGYYDIASYPLLDAEAAVYATDNRTPAIPAIGFDAFNAPNAENVVLSGTGHYFELHSFTPYAKIYYTLNGKKPDEKTGIHYTGKVPITQAGKVKIQAVAVLGGRTSGVFSKTYTFRVLAEELERAYFKENMQIAKGKTLQLGVRIQPENVSSRKLLWTSSDTTKMIKVDQNGKVTCNKKASDGLRAQIKAETTDGSKLSTTFTVIVKSGKTNKVTLNVTKLKMSHWTNEMWNSKGEDLYKTYQLKPVSTAADGSYGTDQYIYKTSNKKVATVNEKGMITALGKGTATITVTANDGSGKKASCKVTVVTPIYELSAISSTGFSDNETIPIGTGCSVTLKTTVNGGSKDYMTKPNNIKLRWSSSDTTQVTVSQNGKVTCRKNAVPGSEVTITAFAKDGYGCRMEIKFRVYDRIKKVVYMDNTGKISNKSTINASLATGYAMDDPLLYGNIKVITLHGTDNYYKEFDFQTSDHNVVMRTKNSQSRTVLMGTAPGKSKVTYTSKDGAKVKFIINFKVVY